MRAFLFVAILTLITENASAQKSMGVPENRPPVVPSNIPPPPTVSADITPNPNGTTTFSCRPGYVLVPNSIPPSCKRN